MNKKSVAILFRVCLVLFILSATFSISYFFSFVLFVATAWLGILWFIKRNSERNAQRSNNSAPPTHHGSAAWSTPEEIERDGFNKEQKGLWVGSGVFRHKLSHILTVAASRQGKGTNIIIPNLLINPLGSYVVTDPKGENAFITAKFQKSAGQKVYILDPWGEQSKLGADHGIGPAGFNPFDFLSTDIEELRDNCEMIAHYLVPDNPDSKDPFWDDKSRTLIRTCLMHIITFYPKEKHNFWTLYKMLRVSGDDLTMLWAEMKVNESCDEIISLAAEEFIMLDPNGNTLPGILSSAQRATTIFESPQLRKSLERSDFNPYDLPNGNCTVYIVIPERYLDSHATWLRIVIGLSLKACNAKPEKPVYFLLDEFPVLGKMTEVIRAYAFGAGQNIRMWTFSQSLSHIKQIYGEDGMNALISNATVFQAFGVSDPYTLEFISKSLGEQTASKTTHSSGYSHGGESSSYSRNVSVETFARPLMTAEEVGKFKGIIMFTQGAKLMIEKLAYYERRFQGANASDPRLSPEQKKLVKSGGQIHEWADFFEDRASKPPRLFA